MENPKAAKSRGGKRAGAGRKRKLQAGTVITEADIMLLTADIAPDEIESAAQRHAREAMSALLKQLLSGTSDAARIRAANEILDRGYGKPAVEIGGDAMLPFAMAPAPPTISSEMREEARKYARLAILVLSRVADFSTSDNARVAAAKALLDRAFGTVGVARMPDEFRERPLGKKEQAQKAADLAAVGRYATPPPPGPKKLDS